MAMNLSDIRKNYPQYSHLSDQDLSDRLHQKFYPQLDKNDFYNRIGFNPSSSQVPNQNPLQQPPSQDNRQLADSLIGQLHQASGFSPEQAPTTPFAQMGKAITTIPRDFGAGLLSAVKDAGSMLPNVTNIDPKINANVVGNMDPYQAFGTENKGVFSPGGLVQTAGEFALPVPPVAKGVQKGAEIAKTGIDLINPEKYANKLAESLKGGAENAQDAGKKIAADIRQRYLDRNSEPQSYYDFINNQVGDGHIFEKPNPLITTEMDKGKNILDRAEGFNLGDLYDNYKANPSFKNAHALQSDLGLYLGDLKAQVKNGTATRAEMNKVANLRNDLLDGMKAYLKRQGEKDGFDYAGKYQTATDLFRENVAPYLSNPKLRQIVRGGKTTVPNIENIFSNPHDIEATEGTKIGPINKILQDLSPETKNQILYKKVGGYVPGQEQNFVGKLQRALQNNYAHLDNENVQSMIEDVNQRMKNKNLAKKMFYYGGVPVATTMFGLDMLHHLGSKE